MSRLISLPGEEGDLRVLKVEASTEFAADVGDMSQNVPAKGSGSVEMLATLKMPPPPAPCDAQHFRVTSQQGSRRHLLPSSLFPVFSANT